MTKSERLLFLKQRKIKIENLTPQTKRIKNILETCNREIAVLEKDLGISTKIES